jgi:hypothetical protein
VKSEIDLQIEKAEKSQSPEDAEEDTDKKISGSENQWESQAEMQSITGKLTRPKNYKTPLQRAKEKKIRENAEKERIRQEILQAEPVNDLDLSEFSGYIAQKSSQSKSEIDIAAEKEERKRVMKEKREDAQRQRKEKLKEQQEEATEMKKQEEV